ncbi:MAG TPA: ABC transporter permease [Gemmataceae bacterium]|nr:ABC transporter permease [Gemmataceae bacterium]
MTKVVSDQSKPHAARVLPGAPGRASAFVDAGAVGALFWLTMRQYCRGKRLLILSLLFALPTVIAILARSTSPEQRLAGLEFGMIFSLIPQALVPLTALLYASGMIQDEIEDQTLTYLLIRPLRKWTIYVVKLCATILVTILLSAVFTMTAFVAVHWGTPELWQEALFWRVLKTFGLLALTLVAYCSIFGWLSLFVKRSLVAGVAYIIVLEGILGNIDFAVRRLSVIYYFRVLALRWLHADWATGRGGAAENWSIPLDSAPSASTCIEILLAAGLVATVLAAAIFTTREFRVKTPEGS